MCLDNAVKLGFDLKHMYTHIFYYLRLTTTDEVIIDNLTTTSSVSTSSSAPSKEPSGVDPTYPPGEIEPLISISIFLIFILLGECVCDL